MHDMVMVTGRIPRPVIGLGVWSFVELGKTCIMEQ